MSLFHPRRAWVVPALLVLLVLLVAACAPVASPGASPSPGVSAAPAPTPPAAIPLHPASPGANPLDLLAWLFTPIFQALFITLVVLDKLVGNMAIAIILLTLIMRAILVPVYRRQLHSQQRMQMLAPELKELRKRYKDRTQRAAAEQEFYRARGINPAGGCLPMLLQMLLLIPMYSVFSAGLQNFNPQAMLDVFGVRLIDLHCDAVPQIVGNHVMNPCLTPIAFGVNWGIPETILSVGGFGISILAIISALVQLVSSRMALQPAQATDDPNARVQRQTALFIPLISIAYGGILPAGLFLYWIIGTIFQIVQQYLIVGWGAMFPLFGWHPAFARDHTPRFPVPKAVLTAPSGDATRGPARPRPVDREASAAATIRQRGRQGRRGRRR